jgi:hypothetical protein
MQNFLEVIVDVAIIAFTLVGLKALYQIATKE